MYIHIPLFNTDCVTFYFLASGDGDSIMRFCPSFHIVQLMHQGKSPDQACDMVVRKITECLGSQVEAALIALDMKVSISCVFSILERNT